MGKSLSREKIIVLSVAGILLIGMVGLWTAIRLIPDKQIPERPVPVVTIRPVRADLGRVVIVPAVLETEKLVTVVPRVGGNLLEVLVEEGDRVTEGQVLAEVDPEPYALDYRAAESAWMLAESSLKRIRSLHNDAGASQQRLDEAQTSRDAAYASYKLAEMKLDYAEIRSPMDGMILRRFADPGNPASPENPLFTVGDAAQLRVAAKVPEKYWDEFNSTGQIAVRIKRAESGMDTKIRATIVRVSPVVDPMGGTFEVLCRPSIAVAGYDDNSGSWPLGAHLQVEFTLDARENVRSLPLNALDGEEGVWFILSEESTVRRLDASTLYRDGKRLELPDSWPDGDYVLEGHHRLIDGQRVVGFGTEA